MEGEPHQHQLHQFGHEPRPVGLEGECTPDEGCWLYVAERTAWDRSGTSGHWIPAELRPHQAVRLMSTFLGRPVTPDELVVVDQVGLEDMVDEDHLSRQRWST